MSSNHSAVALITGASSGIGRAIALDLAGRGYALVVTARRHELLETLAHEVEARWQRPVEVLAADLTDSEGVAAVARRVEGVEVLVANAGFSTRGRFADLPLEMELREIELNVISVVKLCHAAAQAMRSRRRGRILITSSAASFQPLPGLATYSATKSFLTAFAQSLDGELRDFGVTVTCLAPGYVRRKGVPTAGPGWLWMDSEKVARLAVSGMLQGRTLIVPGLPWKVSAALAPRVPRALMRTAARSVATRLLRARSSEEPGRGD